MQRLTKAIAILLIMMNMACQSQEKEGLQVNMGYVPRYVHLQPALDHPDQVYQLDIDMCPRGLERLTNLEYLYFGPCYVGGDVAGEIRKAENISELAIYKCKVDKLELTGKQKEKIEFLNLTFSIFEDTNSTIQCISEMKNLEKLIVSFSNLNYIPASWSSLTKLKSLYVGGAKSGFDIVKSLENMPLLPSLEDVVFSSLSIDSLPSSIKNIKGLKRIGFAACNNLDLSEVYNEIKTWNNIEATALGYTNVERLPEQFAGMVKLKKIEITKAENLDIKQAFSVLSQVKGLDELIFTHSINGTEEETLGQLDDLVKLKNLKKLDLSHSHYISDDYLWDMLGQLPLLEEINLYSTPTFINGAIFNLKHLKKLDISWTGYPMIEKIEKFPESLESLNMETCHLKSFPQQIINSPNLISVNLKDNEVGELPTEISEMKKLIHLDLSYNHLEALPESIKQLKGNLKYLNLMGNPVGEDETKLAEIRKWLPNTEVFGGM